MPHNIPEREESMLFMMSKVSGYIAFDTKEI